MGFYSAQDYILYIGILLLVLYFFLRYIFTRVKIDRKFLLASIPFILLGILIRVLADLGVFEQSKFWSITPGVYLLSIAIGLIILLISIQIQKEFGVEYWIPAISIGAVIILPLIYILLSNIHNPGRAFYPVAIAILITALVYTLSRLSRIQLFQSSANLSIIFAHLLDGASSFWGIHYYGFQEEHLLPRFFISLVGSAGVMIPLKLILILLTLYFIEKWHKQEGNKRLYTLLKFTIFILGIGPGLRNTLLLSF